MSAKTISMCRLVCDTCGDTRDALTLGATSARIQAAAEGWKFTEFDIKGKGLQKRKPDPRGEAGSFKVEAAPRQWDSCPQCPLPSAEEALAIVNRQRAAAS